jgi:hypothetical protein
MEIPQEIIVVTQKSMKIMRHKWKLEMEYH